MTKTALKISKILAQYDLQGLIKMGAPSDEYDSEAKQIEKNVLATDSIRTINKKIWSIFRENFCTGSSFKDDRLWALDLLNTIKQIGTPPDYFEISGDIKAELLGIFKIDEA